MDVYAANWIARVLSLVAVVPLMLIAFGEHGHGPSGLREWIYLLLFPYGFSAGYLVAWYRPFLGGVFAIFCLFASLLVIGRIFPLPAYMTWAGVCIPGLVFIRVGMVLRSGAPGQQTLAGASLTTRRGC